MLPEKYLMSDTNLDDYGDAETARATVGTQNPLAHNHGYRISLLCLLQIVTGCCVFFAILRLSPLVAILGTIIVAPAIIRTGLAAEAYRLGGTPFGISRRIAVFLESMSLVVLTGLFAASIFLTISFAFGIFGMVFGMAIFDGDLSSDVAIVGTAGGMIWGLAGALLAIGYFAYRMGKPTLPKRPSGR